MGDLQWNLNNKWTKLECYCYTVQLIANWIKVIAWWNCTPVEREECSEKAFALNGCDNCLCNDDNGDLNLGLMVMEKNASRRNFLIALQVGLELLARVGIRTIKSRILKCVKYYVSFRVCTYKDLHFRDANLWQNLVIQHSLSLASLSFHCISHSAARAAALLTLLAPPTWCALRAKTVRPIHNTSKFNSISRSLTLSARAKPLAYALPFSHFFSM
jgi:hypothetical protein